MPKRVADNLRWRRSLRLECEESDSTRASVLAACRDSTLFWINAFGWTYRQRKVVGGETVQTKGHDAHIPMITWPIQDEIVSELLDAMDRGQDANCEKSRDMGLTWLVLFVFDHQFLFHPEMNFGVVSRKEVLVDSRGDMDSLFEKLRYIHKMLPAWMMPPVRPRYMHLHNLENNSTIAGESTNTDVGRGGRKTAYLVDEAAAIPNGDDVENSLSQTTTCQIWVSTPKGPSTQFFDRLKNGRGKRLRAPWWRHPEKAHGAHQYRDELDRIRWTSPWYMAQAEKMSVKALAQEVDIDHGKSGDIFFDYGEVERHRTDHMCEPSSRGDVMPIEEMLESEQVETIRQMNAEAFIYVAGHGRSPLRLWIELESDGRPSQHETYIFGIDISNGAGNSNSIITIRSYETGRIVAKWWDAFVSPEALAVIAGTLGVWFGGLRPPPLIVPENNGPGGIFIRKLLKIGHSQVYRARVTGSHKNKRVDRWGWHSNKVQKELLLGIYRDALAKDDIINPCAEALDEALDYIYDETGLLVPASLKEEPSGGRELHGDHVIADALTVLGAEELPKQRSRPRRAMAGTFAHRRDARRHQKRARDPWRN